jgi:predicted transcriptional regulator
MLTIAWNPLRFYMLKNCPKWNIFNAQYDQDNILAELIHIHPERDERKFYVHTDNTSLHIAKKC